MNAASAFIAQPLSCPTTLDTSRLWNKNTRRPVGLLAAVHRLERTSSSNSCYCPSFATTTTRQHQYYWQKRTQRSSVAVGSSLSWKYVNAISNRPNFVSRMYQNLEDDAQSTVVSKMMSINEDLQLATATPQKENAIADNLPTDPILVGGEAKGTKEAPPHDISTTNKGTRKLEEILIDTNDTTTSSIQSIFLLNLVAIIWGTQHSVIKMVVDDCDAASFSFARFALACALASPFLPNFASITKLFRKDSLESDDKQDIDQDALAWKWGIEMGTWMFLGYAFQAIGLEYTTAQRSGFLLYLNVKFVPFFARILFGKEISLPTWVSAFAALAGTALLSYDGTSMSLNLGDLWSVAAATASAMFILRLESATAAVKNSAALNATSLCMVTVTSFVWCILAGMRDASPMQVPLNDQSINSDSIMMWDLMETASMVVSSILSNVANTVISHPLELIYLGGVTTALSNYIQTKAQKGISAERASIIYALDPVYGAFFASLLLGEGLSQYGLVGAGLITVAAATNALLDLGSQEIERPSSSKNNNK